MLEILLDYVILIFRNRSVTPADARFHISMNNLHSVRSLSKLLLQYEKIVVFVTIKARVEIGIFTAVYFYIKI